MDTANCQRPPFWLPTRGPKSIHLEASSCEYPQIIHFYKVFHWKPIEKIGWFGGIRKPPFQETPTFCIHGDAQCLKKSINIEAEVWSVASQNPLLNRNICQDMPRPSVCHKVIKIYRNGVCAMFYPISWICLPYFGCTNVTTWGSRASLNISMINAAGRDGFFKRSAFREAWGFSWSIPSETFFGICWGRLAYIIYNIWKSSDFDRKVSTERSLRCGWWVFRVYSSCCFFAE